MKIDLVDNRLIIDLGSARLDTDHVLQFKFWNFYKNNNYYEASTSENLDKLIQYLNKANLPFTLSNAVSQHLDDIRANAEVHSTLLNSAMNFKKGKYDKVDFDNFNKSLPKLVKRKLKDHQVKSTYHLNLVGNGANFSVPGSGKTTVVLTYFQKLRQEHKVNTLFVVGPPACFYPWQDEYREVIGNKPRAKVLSGLHKDARLFTYSDTSNPYDIYLVTFQTLLNDSDYIKNFLSNPKVNALVVIDEAHYMKRINGNWANAVLNIAHSAKYRCALSGTPIPRSYMDLLNLMDFLWLEKSPITSTDKAQLQIYEDRSDFESAAQLLDPKIGPLFYRVRKQDLGLKPPIFNAPTIIKMNENEQTLYNAIVDRIRNVSREDYMKNADLVSKLRRGRMIRARQCISYSKLLRSALEGYKEEMLTDESELRNILLHYDQLERPAKLEVLLEKAKKLHAENKKVVIWSNFIGTIDLIMNALKKEGLYSKKITGSVPIEKESVSVEETREQVRDEFVDPNSGLDILIANPAACAESISLHKTCHHAIYYDLSYNLAQYLQSLDRIHRVGASEKYSAYYDFLIYENTIDEDILESLKRKAEKMYKVIDKDYSIYSLDMTDSTEDEEAYERLFLKQ